MNLRLIVALALVTNSAVGQTTAGDCQCLWQGSFSEVARTTDLVMQAEVVAVKGNAVDVEPIAQYQGNIAPYPIRVWMRTGDYCRPEADKFPPGSRWILALQQIQELPEDGFNPHTPNQSYGRLYDYTLSACGGYWLEVRGETVIGNLVPGTPRWNHDPDMTPVHLDLVAAYLAGRADTDTLREASQEDPALKALMLDTRSFLRNQSDLLESSATDDPH